MCWSPFNASSASNNQKKTKAQLNRIEAGIIKIQKKMCKRGPPSLEVPLVQYQTWAIITMQAAHIINTITALQKATVHVQFEEF